MDRMMSGELTITISDRVVTDGWKFEVEGIRTPEQLDIVLDRLKHTMLPDRWKDIIADTLRIDWGYTDIQEGSTTVWRWEACFNRVHSTRYTYAYRPESEDTELRNELARIQALRKHEIDVLEETRAELDRSLVAHAIDRNELEKARRERFLLRLIRKSSASY